MARRGRDWPLKTASTFAVGARRKPTEPRMAPLGASDVAGNRAAFARYLEALRSDARILALLGATLAAAA